MKRFTGSVLLALVLAGGALFLTNVPRWIFRSISAPKSGANRKPTAAEMRQAHDSAQRRHSSN